ncbi:hypothetical protein GMST_33660 [Geomonas silvestris]|uniref:Co-chaperone DjlA N-terminal domain-containing protein n=1 Tax=Geomonas silvestris TaxID=2740184 RepID=A0A6V8MLW7_9BACT|nr:TerB family tellurite resistance protein [Geomonas silvestris]GFO61041.1 hypothetical protein GMST_33660 [Geomonas silvestris]
MSVWKSLGWVAAGVGAIVAAPITGGGSLAVLIGAAGTTTAAGVALGAAAGLAGKTVFDQVSGDSDEAERYRKEAEENLAGWKESEAKRKAQAEQHRAEAETFNATVANLLKKYESLLAEVKRQRFTRSEVELMYTLAAAAAQTDGHVDEKEFEAAANAISFLCIDPEESLQIGRDLFNQPMSIESAMAKVSECRDSRSLDRLGFVLDMVVQADEHVAPGEQAILDAFQEHVLTVRACA